MTSGLREPRNQSLVAIIAFCICGGSVSAQEVLHRFYGDSYGDLFGSVSSVGDVDGDGHDDLLVGSRYDDHATHDGGSAFIYSGLTGQVLVHVFNTLPYSSFGLAVSEAGDINGDGFPDFIVGSPYADTAVGSDSGMARVFSGQDGTEFYALFPDDADDKFGYSVCAAGDVDGDGLADVAVGAPSDEIGGIGAGSVRTFSGANGALLSTKTGSHGDRMGIAVARVGDIDGDGIDELVGGAALSIVGGENAGAAEVFSALTAATLYSFYGDSAGDYLGLSVGGAGDVDGDGVPDILAGATQDVVGGVMAGSVQVRSGRTGGLLALLEGTAHGERFGSSVSGVGDMDGDGKADIVVGGFGNAALGTKTGAARVYLGGDYSLHLTVFGDHAGDGMGAVSDAGDVNQDGIPDLLLGATLDGSHGPKAGMAKVIAGCDSCVFVPTGIGCAGGGQTVPELTLSGAASPGGTVSLSLDAGTGDPFAVLILSTDVDDLDLGTGCSLYIDSTGLPTVGPLLLAQGKVQVSGVLPQAAVPTWFVQGLVSSPSAPMGFTVTGAVGVYTD